MIYKDDFAYRPANDANVSFRLLRGSGTLSPVATRGGSGRYAAVYQAGTTTGDAEIEVALPTNAQMPRQKGLEPIQVQPS